MPAAAVAVAAYQMYDAKKKQKDAAGKESAAMADRDRIANEEKARWNEQVAPVINYKRRQGLSKDLTDGGKLALGSMMNKIGETRQGLLKGAGNAANWNLGASLFGADMEEAKGRGLIRLNDNQTKNGLLSESATLAAKAPDYVGYQDRSAANRQSYYEKLNAAMTQQFNQAASTMVGGMGQMASGWAAAKQNGTSSWMGMLTGAQKAEEEKKKNAWETVSGGTADDPANGGR